ncbi:MAG: hypothetical protein QW478_15000, partial [Candidatus Micrarchaeaceae archaeon]
MGDAEDITEKPVAKKIVLLPVIIASFIIFLILLHDGILTSLNLSLGSIFAITFTVTISIFISLLLAKHFTAAILFFIYPVWGTFVTWLFYGMPGTSVLYSTAYNYWGYTFILTSWAWMFIFVYLVIKLHNVRVGGPDSYDLDSRPGRSRLGDENDSLYPYSPRARLAREIDLPSSYNDNLDFYAGLHGLWHSGTAAN